MALLLVLLLTPILEMYLVIRIGGQLGAWPTIGLVILTAVVGIALLRRQGPAAMKKVMLRAQRGDLPARELAEGALLALAGLLLLVPGFMTDAVGLALLVPACRAALARRLVARFPPGSPLAGATTVIIEGEFERAPDAPDAPSEPPRLRDRP